jgi:hypothetical protein
MNEQPRFDFGEPRAIEFRFLFSSEIDANNFADSFDDAFLEVDGVGVSHIDSVWFASAIAPVVRDLAELQCLSIRLVELAKVSGGQPHDVLLFG